MQAPQLFFEDQLADSILEEAKARKKVNVLAISRLAAFALLLAGMWCWNAYGQSIWGLWALVTLTIFLVLMRAQQRAKVKRDFHRNRASVNRDEIARLSFQFSREDNGEQFATRSHFYAGDLDIFGSHSLYRLLNRTRTSEGSKVLADWLLVPAEPDEILLRQDALREIKRDPEWMQRWQATAMLHEYAAQEIGSLYQWVQEPIEEPLKKLLPLRWWLLATIGLGITWAAGILPSWPFWLSILGHVLLLRSFQAYLGRLMAQTYRLGKTLAAYSDLFSLLENKHFATRWWQMRQPTKEHLPSKAMAELSALFNRIDYRNNVYFLILVGIPGLWDLFCIHALSQWKQKHAPLLKDWIDSLADTEAMLSLSGFAFANPETSFPEVVWENSIRFEVKELGHPLIPPVKRVNNDFTITGNGNTVLVTGSNMSGKSTFLRTVGINLVMAQMGGVVCGKSLVCAPCQVFTSMRTQDSLEENTSSFYAELKRLRLLLELSEQASTVPVFYLLDEILKGTNSKDRHSGAEAIIKQLHPLAASGMVSTHDLELGEWADGVEYVQNAHFKSDVVDGQLNFDYKLQNGICQRFNAAELMRMMGIKL